MVKKVKRKEASRKRGKESRRKGKPMRRGGTMVLLVSAIAGVLHSIYDLY